MREAGLKESKIQKVGMALQKAYAPSIDAGMASFFLELVGFLDQAVKEIDDQLARLICEDQRIGKQIMLPISIPGGAQTHPREGWDAEQDVWVIEWKKPS